MNPRALTEVIEHDEPLPSGSEERFSGYGVMGVTFSSGHVLALRRFPASSIGPGYSSVWHRDPGGRWTIYSTVVPDLGCSRYFGAHIARNVVTPIQIEWMDDMRFRVAVGTRVRWDVGLRRSAATAFLSGVARLVPEPLWQSPRFVRVTGAMAGIALGAGKVNLVGSTPNGHRFLASPRRLWLVASSQAVIGGVDLGAVGPLARQASLGDFLIPTRGVFAVAQARFRRPVESGGTPVRNTAVTADDQCVH